MQYKKLSLKGKDCLATMISILSDITTCFFVRTGHSPAQIAVTHVLAMVSQACECIQSLTSISVVSSKAFVS